MGTTDDRPLVSFSVVNYNGSFWLTRCLRSIIRLDYPRGRREIIVVDNGSTDHSEDEALRQFPEIRLIRNPRNNYCAAHNLAIKASRGTFVVLMNNDVELDPEWLRALLEVMQPNPRIGVTQGKLMWMDQRTVLGMGALEYPDFIWGYCGFRDSHLFRSERPREFPFISGTAVLFRRACLEEIGGLDEDFHCYHEDVDFALRCWQRGWRLYGVPDAMTGHANGGTIRLKERKFLLDRNRLLIVAKHFPERLPDAVRRFTANRLHEAVVIGIVKDALRKLVREHPGRRAAPILERVFRELEQGFEEACRLWMQYYTRRLERLAVVQRLEMSTLLEEPVSSS